MQYGFIIPSGDIHTIIEMAGEAEEAGWDGDAMEAEAFAYLAMRAKKGLPLSLPTTTGVPQPMTGGKLHRKS